MEDRTQTVMDGIDFSVETKSLLLQPRLPASEPDLGIDFTRLAFDIPPLDTVLREKDIEPFLDIPLRVIGYGLYDSYFCVQEGAVNPVYLVYSLTQKLIFVNSSVAHFAEALSTHRKFTGKFLAALRRDDLHNDWKESERITPELEIDLKRIDPPSMNWKASSTEWRSPTFWCDIVFHIWG